MDTEFNRIIQWNKERNIPKSFDMELQFNLLEEELDEMYSSSSSDEAVDALCDMIVVAVGGLWKLGYDPTICMSETLKEIESRTGKIDADTGKWTKVLTGNEYTADYNLAEVIGD